MSEPNSTLRAVRLSMRMSQDELARAVRQAGQRAGEPNTCTKRLVQRWEAGLVTMPRGAYARALEYVTGQPVESLGFKPADESYGLDRGQVMDTGGGAWIPAGGPESERPSDRHLAVPLRVPEYQPGRTFAGEHYVVVIQHGARLQVRSVPGSASRLMMDLTVNGQVVTGTWTEQTDPAGYYQGACTTAASNSCLTRPATG